MIKLSLNSRLVGKTKFKKYIDNFKNCGEEKYIKSG